MIEKYFLTQIKINTEGTVEKGVVVKDTLNSARQSFHAYLGAYGYGQAPNIIYVQCLITDMNGRVTDSIVDDRTTIVVAEEE